MLLRQAAKIACLLNLRRDIFVIMEEMAQKIIRIGSSNGVTLSQNLLEQAGLRYGDKVTVSLDSDGSIRIRSLQYLEDYKSVTKIMRALEKHRDEINKIDD